MFGDNVPLPVQHAGSDGPLRVAFFTESLYPLVDGVSRTLARLFETLEDRGVEFLVVSPFVPEEGVSWRHRVVRAPYGRFPLYPDYRVSLPGSRRVRRAVDGFRPDLVHVVSPTPMAVWAQRYARRAGVPVVASFHTHFVSYFRYYGFPRLEPGGWRMLGWFYRRCDRVYAPSRSIVEELGTHGLEHVELWSRGIDTSDFSPALRDRELRYSLGVSDDRPLLLLVSRLVKEKDLADLAEMERVLAARGVAHRLALVGDGPMREELERMLPGAVFAGHQSGRQLAKWYASADVFVFPSTTETLGNVVLEAMASGLPPVVVDRGGPRDLVERGVTGFVARANDPADLADHAARLLTDANLRGTMGEAARRAASRRDWAVINGSLIDRYGELVSDARRDAARGADRG